MNQRVKLQKKCQILVWLPNTIFAAVKWVMCRSYNNKFNVQQQSTATQC